MLQQLCEANRPSILLFASCSGWPPKCTPHEPQPFCGLLLYQAGLTCVTDRILTEGEFCVNVSVGILTSDHKRHCGFHQALSWISRSVGSQMPSVKTSKQLHRDPCGKELRPPVNCHLSEPSWRWILQTQSSLRGQKSRFTSLL